MTEPTDEQINARIADFMGLELPWTQFGFEKYSIVTGRTSCFSYTTSLDALIPVVEKIESDKFHLFAWWNRHEKAHGAKITFPNNEFIEVLDKSPARALAMAIYEVLENE